MFHLTRISRYGRAHGARLYATLHPFKSPFPDVDIPNQSIPEYVLQVSEGPSSKFGEDVALKLSKDRSLTYNQLKQDVFSFGAALHKEFGLKKGDLIGILAPNCPEYGTAVHGSTALGIIVSPFNPTYTETEIKHQLKDSKAKFMITYGGEYLAKLQKANAELGSPVKEFVIGDEKGDGLYQFADVVKSTDISAFPKVKIDPSNDVAILPYSSGTTGLPKGVVLTHRNLVANIAQIRVPELYRAGRHSLIGVLPMFHIYGQVLLLNVGLAVGARLNLMEKFEPVEFLRVLQDEKVNIAHLVPPIVLFLAKHPMVDEYDLSSLEEIFSGAAPLGKDLSELVMERLPNIKFVRQGYGMTELSPAATIDPLANIALGSAGAIVPNTEIRILDLETHQPLGPNVEGEVCVRGPQVMREYLDNAQATKETIDADGFLRTGDVGYVTEDGHLYIEDRVKELIKVKGFQVAPAELEAHLLGHEQVADACVVQKHCDRAGELPKAYVVPKDKATADKEKIRSDVNSHLAEHKHIVEVEFIDAIPKSASGKILRRILRDRDKPKKTSAGPISALPA